MSYVFFRNASPYVSGFDSYLNEASELRQLTEDFNRSAKLTMEQIELLQEEAKRYLGRVARPPPLPERQWWRPRWATRACGGRHRVMLG